MSSSRRSEDRTRRHPRRLWLVAAVAWALIGCAHGGHPSEREHSAGAPHSPPQGEGDTASALPPPSRPTQEAQGAARGSRPAHLDPSEEITPEELASIPDPVPPARATAPPRAAIPPPSAPPGGSKVETEPSPIGSADSTAAKPPERAWCVQIFASESLTEAERVARDASAKLQARASVDFEGSLYKVRLGAFESEGDAQALRERAVRMGYPGAFRTRLAPRGE